MSQIANDELGSRSSRHLPLLVIGLISGLALSAALFAHIFGLAAVFGYQLIKIENELPEIGHAFIVTLPNSALQNLAGYRSTLTEDGRQLGPVNSQHDTIRSIGKGAYSFWNGTLYFSASDNSDPRTNGRTYLARTPAMPPLWSFALAGLLTLSFGWASYRAASRERILRAAINAGFDRLFLALALFTIIVAILRPWDGLLRTVGLPGDWYRLIAAAGISILFVTVRASEFAPSARVMSRTMTFLFGAICVLRWYPEFITDTNSFNSWTIFGNRYVGLAAAVVSWWRPSFLIYSVGSAMWGRRSHEFMTGFHQADVDETPVSEMVIFFILWCCVAVISSRFSKKFDSHEATRAGLYATLGIHLANYFHSAVAKLSLDGPLGTWLQNPTHALLATAKELDVAPLGAFPKIFDFMYQTMGAWISEVNVFTLGSQAVALPAILLPAVAPWLLVLYDMWHLAVFATAGILFWKWIAVNVGFFAALRRDKKPKPAIIALSAALCIFAPKVFHIFAAGWYDTFTLNRLTVKAIADDGSEVRVPPAFFFEYAFAANSSTFWRPQVVQSLYPTDTYGSTLSSDVMKRSASCPEAPGFREQPKPFKAGLGKLVRALDRATLNSSDHDRPDLLMYMSFPYHITTNPLEFSAFWSMDLRRIRAYEIEIQAVCTARQSLNDPVVEGPQAVRRINVER